jgi:aryl-alcohol dehydrogenase-like predicted oxidoreductase
MEYRQFGRTGMRVSVLGLGCGGFGGVGSAPELFGKGEDRQTAFSLMNFAFDAGINYFDTADSYGGGESERTIGAWLKERKVRDQLVLSTKVFYPMPDGPADRSLSRRHIMQAIDNSLRRLATDYVDLYVTMEPDPNTSEEETLAAMTDLVKAGKVRFIGSSNVTAQQLRASLDTSEGLGLVRYQSIQNGYNLLERQMEADLFPLAASRGLAVTPFSPTAGGLLTGKYEFGKPPPPNSRLALRPQPYIPLMTEATFRSLGRLRAQAAARNLETGALALAWVLSHPAVTAALIGPRRVDHFSPWLQALEIRLSPLERDALVNEMGAAA